MSHSPRQHAVKLAILDRDGTLNAVPVKTFVVDKLGVFGRNERPLEVAGNPFVRHPFMAQFGLGVVLLQTRQLLGHESTG